MKQRTKRTPSVLVSGLSLVLVIAVVVIGIRIGIGSQMSLFCGAVVAMVVGLLLGIPWEEIQKSMLKVIDNSMVAILILIIVGIMIGAWIIGGTVPSLMYYGLKLCTPRLILPLTFVLCSIMSVFTGKPMTGSVVYAAITPPRCAALPAAQIITSVPLSFADEANSCASSGVLCALITRTSVSTPSFLRAATAGFTTGKSDFEPIRIATLGITSPVKCVLLGQSAHT